MAQPFTVVICVLNSKYVHSSLAPWCLAAGIEKYCGKEITAKVIEGTINEPPADIARRIADVKPQVIGFSCYIWNIAETITLVHSVKEKLPDAVIVFGGPEVSYNAFETLKNEPLIDFVISGEGEKPFAMLAGAICRSDNISGIPGLNYRQEDRIITSSPYTPDDTPPSPYTDRYFSSLKGRIAYLETSRGCPYNCAFCLSGRCGGVRYYPVERAKEELLLLARSGTKTVKLVDRTFNANRRRAAELFGFITENYGTAIPEGVCFHFEIAGDILDGECIRLLASAPAGSIQLEIGLQSFNERTLAAVNRKTDVKKLKANVSRLLETGNIHIHIDLIAGLPFEDLDSFAESFDTAFSLKPHMLQLGFLKLLHGSPMRDNPAQFPCSYNQNPPYEVISTPWISKDELLMLHRLEDAFDRLYNSGRFRRTLEYTLSRINKKPFELFREFGRFAAGFGTEKIPLDDYTALVYQYFGAQDGIDKAVLRDIMVCDRLAANSSGKLPPILKISDPALKSAITGLESISSLRRDKGIKRGYALLYSENCLVYADYKKKDPVTGEYPLYRFKLSVPSGATIGI